MSDWYERQARRGVRRINAEQNFARRIVAAYGELGWLQTVAPRRKAFYDLPAEQEDGTSRTVLVFHVEYPDTDDHTKVHIDGDQPIPTRHQEGEFKPDERIVYIVRNGKWVVRE